MRPSVSSVAHILLASSILICHVTAWMIHGGGFLIGGSHHIPIDQVEWFLEQGIAVVSNEYRLLPQYVNRSNVPICAYCLQCFHRGRARR